MMRSAFLVLVALAAPAPAQPNLVSGDEMVDAFLKRETKELSKHFLDGAATKAAWQEKRDRLKSEYFEMLGLSPMPEKTPLDAKITGTIENGPIAIDKLYFQSRPGLYVTGNLYRPKGNDKKLPAILYVCGHSNKGRDGNKTAYQEHGAWFASHGFVCLIIDTLQLGEIAGQHHGTYRLGRWWWQSRGYTPAGVECWNGIRAIDYLVSRSDVDAERIGVTGISGGGASTIWIAAADARVKAAAAVSGMSDLESYVSNKVINGHCDCMFMINTYAWDWPTIPALIAPRALLFANSDQDPIFPMDGNRRVAAKLRMVYDMYDKSNQFEEYVSSGGHAYRPDLRVAVFSFLNKHLNNGAGKVEDVVYTPLPGKQLRVFPEDSDLPKDAINDRIDETFVPVAKVALPEQGKFDEWKKDLIHQLQSKCFRAFPQRIPGDSENLKAQLGDTHSGFRIRTDEDTLIRIEWEEGSVDKPVSWIVLNQDDLKYGVPKWAEDVLEGECYMCSPRGHGVSEWTRKNPPNYVERSFPLLGRTVDEMRVWDAVVSFRGFYPHSPKRTWQMAGRGVGGIISAYAALFEPTIASVVLYDPPSSHKDGPYFLNVMRVLDIPEALGLLAPRPLTIYSNDKAFERTAEIYKIAGAADKFKIVPLKKK
jgi:dienelactone hydrolase